MAIDLNLFVDAASRGWNDGAKVPTPFAAFLNGIATGTEQNYKNQVLAQQAEQTRLENEQAPYKKAVLEAQAKEAELKTQAMTENPEAFKEDYVKKAELAKAEKAREMELMQQEGEVVDILKNGSPDQKAEATLSGKYAQLIAAKPQYGKQLEATVPTWTNEAYKKQFFERDQAARRQQLWADAEAKQQIEAAEIEKDYLKNPNIDILASTIGNQLGVPVGRPDLLLKGRVVQEKLNLKYDPKTGETVPNKFTMDTPKWEKVFYYGDKPYYGLDPDMLDILAKYQSNYNTQTKAGAGQGGITDLKTASDEVDKARLMAAEKAKEEANVAQATRAEQQRSFTEGMKVADKYKAAESDVLAQQERNRQERIAKSQPASTQPNFTTPTHTAIPTEVPAEQKVIVTPAIKTTAPTAPTASTPMPSPMPEVYQKRYQQNELARAKAAEALKRRKPVSAGGTQAAPTATPVQQATAAIAPTSIPAEVEVKISKEPPSEAVVNKVSSVLDSIGAQDASALMKAVIATESAGNPNAVSPTGVTGLAQTTVATAQGVIPSIKNRKDLLDPRTSFAVGAIELASLQRTFEDSPLVALIGYNAGIGVAKDLVATVGAEPTWEQIQSALPSIISKYYKNPEAKLDEVLKYPQRVMSYFPKFLSSPDDMRLAQVLKEQGIIDYA